VQHDSQTIGSRILALLAAFTCGSVHPRADDSPTDHELVARELPAVVSTDDVVVQVQQEKVAGPEDVDRLIDLARKRQRHYAAVLVQRNSEGLRWIAMNLE